MLLTLSLLLAMQPAGPATDPRLACAPVRNLTAGGPPPAVFHAQRMEVAPESRVYLSVHRCRGGTGMRVERNLAGANGADRGDVEWVPVSQCAALGGWIEAATRLRLPSPMLRPHRTGASPQRGTWFTLNAPALAGAGTAWNLELEILDPPGAPRNALGAWFTDGERLFQQCRDQGHGGTGYLPPSMGMRR